MASRKPPRLRRKSAPRRSGGCACGGRSILRPAPLERLYRDARCGATMLPWSVEVCLDRLGAYGITEPGDGEAFA